MISFEQVTKSSRRPPFAMQTISYLAKGASVLSLIILTLINLSWQNPVQVHTALAYLTEPGDELDVSLGTQLAFIPPSDQVADQTPLISSTSESGSKISFELHSIATILLNLNLASRSGLAKPSVRSIYPLYSNALSN